MKILVDENIPLRTVRELWKRGYDVLDIRGTPDDGMRDAQLWELAQDEGRLFITTDKGFASHRNELHHGIFKIRLRHLIAARFTNVLFKQSHKLKGNNGRVYLW